MGSFLAAYKIGSIIFSDNDRLNKLNVQMMWGCTECLNKKNLKSEHTEHMEHMERGIHVEICQYGS